MVGQGQFHHYCMQLCMIFFQLSSIDRKKKEIEISPAQRNKLFPKCRAAHGSQSSGAKRANRTRMHGVSRGAQPTQANRHHQIPQHFWAVSYAQYGGYCCTKENKLEQQKPHVHSFLGNAVGLRKVR